MKMLFHAGIFSVISSKLFLFFQIPYSQPRFPIREIEIHLHISLQVSLSNIVKKTRQKTCQKSIIIIAIILIVG